MHKPLKGISLRLHEYYILCINQIITFTFGPSFFTMFISIFGAFGWKIEAPWTIPLAPGASIGENTVVNSLGVCFYENLQKLYF